MNVRIVNVSGDRTIFLKEDSIGVFMFKNHQLNLYYAAKNNEDDGKLDYDIEEVVSFSAIRDMFKITVPDHSFDTVAENLNEYIIQRDYESE